MAWRTFLRQKVFSKYLLLTNTIMSGVLDGLGDSMEQRLERIQPHDWGRTARMAAVGFAFGPLDHYWYKVLDRKLPGRTAVTIARKIMLEMLLMGPLQISAFYIAMCKLERMSWKDSVHELKEKFVVTYKVIHVHPLVTYKLEWTIWPLAQMINFYFIPSPFRLLYCNIVDIGWSMVLSYLKHQTNQTKQLQDVQRYHH